MFEICALLAPKTAKPRKARGPSIKVGAAVIVYGRPGVVVGKHEKNATWWNVAVEGRPGVSGFDRSQIDVVA